MNESILDFMTVRPLVLPMHPAEFLAFAYAIGSEPEVMEAYQKETGESLDRLAPRSCFDALVDKATGNVVQKMAIAKYLDWLAIWYWGVEGCICEDESVNPDCQFHGR